MWYWLVREDGPISLNISLRKYKINVTFCIYIIKCPLKKVKIGNWKYLYLHVLTCHFELVNPAGRTNFG